MNGTPGRNIRSFFAVLCLLPTRYCLLPNCTIAYYLPLNFELNIFKLKTQLGFRRFRFY